MCGGGRLSFARSFLKLGRAAMATAASPEGTVSQFSLPVCAAKSGVWSPVERQGHRREGSVGGGACMQGFKSHSQLLSSLPSCSHLKIVTGSQRSREVVAQRREGELKVVC